MSRRRRLARVVAFTLLAGAACVDDGVRDVTGTPTTDASGPATAGPGFRPRFLDGPCTGPVPEVTRVRCGWLVVREDRLARSGPTVRLPVAVVRGTRPEGDADPVVYLAGGPGESGLEAVGGFLDRDLTGGRDVVLFDQRGTGSARPSLDCPEVEEAVEAVFGTADRADVEQRVIGRGFGDCRARLVEEGVDLAQYRTETSADDVEDLRRALGYDQVDLFGVSYGTALALTVLRRHPEGVRSVVLDAVYPTTIANGPAEVAANARRALDALVSGCAAAPSCAAVAPDLTSTLESVVRRLDAEPHEGTVADARTGDPIPVRITGADVIAGVVQGLYRPAVISALPAALVALDGGDESAIDGLASQGLTGLTRLSEGMAVSVECADRARVPSRGDLSAVLRTDPAMGTLGLIASLGAACPEWDVPPASPAFSTPVRSDVPALLLSGAFDPVTPPPNADAVADGLTRAAVVVLSTGGHGAVFALPCAVGVMAAFLDEPERAPDRSCARTPVSPWS